MKFSTKYAMNADTGKMCLILIQRRRHGLTSTVKFVPSITLDLLLEWKQLVLVECGSVQKEKNKLRYTTFLGDGDSKSFSAVSQEVSYPVAKIDCVGHVQKRLGTRLHNLVKKEKFADGSRLGGKGKLTKGRIDNMQNYFGQAIRSHSHDLEGMQMAVKAILYHSVDSENREEQHQYCPKGKDSWCKFQKDKENQTDTYSSSKCLPATFLSKLKPTFDDLSSADLLSRCINGYTQNANESLHGMIWSRCPKAKSFGMQQSRFSLQCLQRSVNSIREQNSTLHFWNQ